MTWGQNAGRAAVERRRFGARRLVRDEDGTALTETIIVLPVMLALLIGLLEFGLAIFTKLEVETGLRDASRYVSRCTPIFTEPDGTSVTNNCNLAMAKNIAVYGVPNPPGGAVARVPGWTPAMVTINSRTIGTGDTVNRVYTQMNYRGSSLLAAIGITSVPLTAVHEDRFYGW